MSKIEETQMEIDLGALRHNYRLLRSRLGKETRFMAVVKAFAYGSEAGEIARQLEEAGADYFAVAYTKEGVSLRKAGVRTPIMVLHPQSVNHEQIIEHCLEPALYSQLSLRNFTETAARLQQSDYPIHLKFNTGLNRLGFHPDEATELGEALKDSSSVKVKSVFSHLAATEDAAEEAFTRYQIEHFETLFHNLKEALGYQPWRHILNTSGILNYPEAQYEMVRSGIGLYGYGNDPEVDRKLQPVASLKTVISQLHQVSKGQSVGYNRVYKAAAETTTATLPIGHADGINRIYGKGKGFVYIHGQKAPIIGNVCMDMIMVDVSGIPCAEGDEVLLFGPGAPAEELAAAAGTISYELITGISRRVKRIVVNRS